MPEKIPRVSTLPTPVKSANDKKDYKCIQLPNGLKALLISDTSYDLSKLDKEEEDVDFKRGELENAKPDNITPTKKFENVKSGLKQSAAALCVGVGNYSDPDELPGLAHFLEHMVFMGSEKYPSENGYDKFITDHGGHNNAWTSHEVTNFYFTIQRKYFKEGLDMFAQFFIKPLILKSAMEREREAVDSEFQIRQPKDHLRIHEVYISLANKNHPYR